MDEATIKGDADYILLLDDDVVCEPEGILRAVTFADLAKGPMLVGGHMFSLYDRSVMHTYGERVARWRWFWGPAPGTEHAHNFARKPLRTTKWLHRRIDVDFNGWWMCLIPTRVVREVGLSLPMFIKWDDAEFGLRAGAAGYPTVSLPGSAVWHVPWHEKDDTIDWQAYFHRRNRIVAALLHSPYDHGGKLVQESLETQVRHLLVDAVRAGRDGPDGDRGHPRRSRADAPRRTPPASGDQQDAQGVHRLAGQARARRVPWRRGAASRRVEARCPSAPKSKIGFAKSFAMSVVRQALPVRELSREYPEANVAHLDLKWWLLAQLDSALVSSADGTSASWYKRDPEHVPRPRQAVGRAPRAAGQGVAGAVRAVQGRAAGPRLAEDLGGVVRRVHQAAVLSRGVERLLPSRRRRSRCGSAGRRDFTVAAVAELIGSEAHAALGRNETTPALRRTADGSALVDVDAAVAAAGAGAGGAMSSVRCLVWSTRLCAAGAARSARSVRCARARCAPVRRRRS